jgi:hypothetical protein
MCVYKKEEFYKEGTSLKVSIFSNISVVCLFIVMQRHFVAYIIAWIVGNFSIARVVRA